MSEVSQESVSRERVDVKRIKIVPDGASFTGYSIVPMDKDGAGQPGLPASVFEVSLYREMKRLERENIKLRTFVDKLRGYLMGDDVDLEEIERQFEAFLVGVAVAAEESEGVAS